MADRFEVYHVRSGKRPGWRFRMFRDGAETHMLTSNGSYETPDEASRVAAWMNRRCFFDHYKVVIVAP